MRYFEITSGVRIHVSGEEQDILDKAADTHIAKHALDDREREVARRMVSRGILKRFKMDDKIHFKKNKERLWRD